MSKMPEVGQRAPDFKMETDTGGRVSLKKFKGNPLVLYFYPKDDTPGCTKEAIAFTGALRKFEKAGAAVIGVSKDSCATHAKFREKYDLGHALAADEPRLAARLRERLAAWRADVNAAMPARAR